MTRFAFTIFLSAFLLFQVQPLIAKYILPWFGGGPSVWTTCLLFFQVLLLGGYAYAHLLSSHLRPRLQIVLHLALLGASILLLPIIPDAQVWKPEGSAVPTRRILLLLLANVGFPYLLLSSTGPLLQRWFHDAFPGRSPYRLYALSNTGSLLALLSYPVVFEPILDVDSQARGWSLAYALFAIGSAACALRFRSQAPSAGTQERAKQAGLRPSAGQILLWLALAASASAMLMATTNQISLELSVVPFLWIVPLSLYLLSFIISFDSPRWYDRRLFAPLLVVAVAVVGVLDTEMDVPIWAQLGILSGGMFMCCMTCHGELVRRKPHPQYLTGFYLVVATGGALGGTFVAVVAPEWFLGFWEFPIALAACCSFTLVSWTLDRFGGSDRRLLSLGFPFVAALFVLYGTLVIRVREDLSGALHISRNFYGLLRIEESIDDVGAHRLMLHGQVTHGFQYLEDSWRRRPTSYYSPGSGIGLALRKHPRRLAAPPSDQSLRVGVVGLGTGTAAVYLRPSDSIRFYEINPEVIEAAREYFTYMDDSGAQVEIVEGDARMALEQELTQGKPRRFDVLAIDAFSSGSVPVHLLTAEAADIYWEHLEPDGILTLNVSNQYLDLVSVARGMAAHLGCVGVLVSVDDDEKASIYASDWVILTRNTEFLAHREVAGAVCRTGAKSLLWTDKYASLWRALSF